MLEQLSQLGTNDFVFPGRRYGQPLSHSALEITLRKVRRTTLETYCARLWDMPVDEIDTAAVLSVLTPLWARVPETASRVRGRIENVLDAAHAHGLIPQTLANPARWKGHLAHLLPKRGKLTRGHYPAIQYSEIPDFLARLREHESIAVFVLEFTILTAARSGEVLGARWSEIDLTTKVWEIPAHRMKAGVAHRVPLCDRALSIRKCAWHAIGLPGLGWQRNEFPTRACRRRAGTSHRCAGADLHRVHILKSIRRDDKDHMFLLAEDLDELRCAIVDIGIGLVRLVTMDPVTAYMGGG
jgi:integrase